MYGMGCQEGTELKSKQDEGWCGEVKLREVREAGRKGGTWRARAGTRKSVWSLSGGGGARVVCAGHPGKDVWS